MKKLELTVKEYKEMLEEKMDYCVLRYDNESNSIIYHICLKEIKTKYAYAWVVKSTRNWLTDEITYSKKYMVQIPRREFLFYVLEK